MADNRCEQCMTEGITILPVRWGGEIVNNKVGFFSRLLHEGYIYILDNKDKWYGYVITEGRYLKAFNVKNVGKTPDLPLLDASCHKGDNCTALSRFIRIPNPSKNIETLWLAYSPVKWTQTILERHKKNTDNAKTNNMIEIPVSATQSKTTASLEQSQSQNGGGYDLWRYDPDGKGEKPNTRYFTTEDFGDINPFTKEPYRPDKSNEKDSLEEELLKIEDSGNRVLNVYFDDAVGKLIDLNEFIIDAQIHFAEADEDVRKYLVGKLVQNLKANLHKKQDADSERLTNRVIGQSDSDYKNVIQMARITGREEEALRLEREYAEIKTKQAGNLPDYMKGQRDHAWSDYAKHINETSMNAFLTSHEHERSQQMIKLNAIIDELAKAYKEVYQSDNLLACMTHNFDKDDDLSRAYYTLTVQQFLGSTANIPMLADLYAENMNDKSAQDESNYIARALIFNQDDVAQKVENINATAGFATNEVLTTSWSGLLYAGSAKIFTKYDAIAKQVEAIVGLTE